ncbi:MAG: protein-glutamate O-methyltransferase CheR [Pirellulales bacterium]
MAIDLSAEEPDSEAIEIQLLLEGVFRRYGFDFRDYAYSSIRRRIWTMIAAEELQTIAQLQEKLLHDRDCMERFLLTVTVHVTSMFRDPGFYLALRAKVVPLLRSTPFIRVWHVGCSTGEEVYSMTILLTEEGLYPKCRVYATDMSEAVLAKAKAGIFPAAALPEYTANYQQAGGQRSLSDYYTSGHEHVIFQRTLSQGTVFSQHNLVTDASFNEFQVILCRNVMIYFNKPLADRVHDLLFDSLAIGGFLGLGSKESIRFTPHEACYEEFDASEHLYRRRS